MADHDIETMIDAYAAITRREEPMKVRENVTRHDKVVITVELPEDNESYTDPRTLIKYQPTVVTVTFDRYWEDGKIKLDMRDREWRTGSDAHCHRILKSGALSDHLSRLWFVAYPDWYKEAIEIAFDRLGELAKTHRF